MKSPINHKPIHALKPLHTLLILGFIMSITFHLDAQIPTTGLLGHWSFNNHLNDESGNNNDGTLSGNALIAVADRFGNQNSAYSFNGTNNYVNVGSNYSLSSAMTVSTWVKTNNIPNSIATIIEKYNGPNAGFLLRIFDNSPDQTRIGGRDGSGSYTSLQYPNDVILNDSWHHVVGIINGSSWQLWLDGVLVNSLNTGYASTNLSNSDNLIIGNWINGPNIQSHYFKGSLDDIRLYNRALTASEVSELYNETPGVGGPSIWTQSGSSIHYNSGNVGIGIINPPAKLTVDGAGLFTQVKVKTDVSTFPDFVFEPDYPLMTISEVDNYIQTHGHLPDIPTAQEAINDGHDIGAMNLKLLQKIEELTLYTIQQEERLNKEASENNEIKSALRFTQSAIREQQSDHDEIIKVYSELHKANSDLKISNDEQKNALRNTQTALRKQEKAYSLLRTAYIDLITRIKILENDK